MALKDAHGGEAVWTAWEPGAAFRRPDEAQALERLACRSCSEIAAQFRQFVFFRQWKELRQYCHRRGIRIMGDLPIYVAHDSADVWSHPELF